MSAPARPVPDLAAAEAVAVLMTGVGEGTLTAATMAEAAVGRCREVFGQCDGPTDPLWPVHVEVCRAVLGHGGIAASELAQWLAVARSRENPHAGTATPADPVSPLDGPHSPDSGDAERDADRRPESVAAEPNTVDTTDILTDIPPEVLAEAEAAALAVIETYRRDRGADQ